MIFFFPDFLFYCTYKGGCLVLLVTRGSFFFVFVRHQGTQFLFLICLNYLVFFKLVLFSFFQWVQLSNPSPSSHIFFIFYFIFIIVFFPIIETEKVQETQASSPYKSNYSKRQKNWFGIGFLFKSNKTARGEKDTNNESYITIP